MEHGSAVNTLQLVQLTRRERQILSMLAEGCTNKELATRLGVSTQTVKNQLSTLYQKASVGNRLELVVCAIASGVIQPR